MMGVPLRLVVIGVALAGALALAACSGGAPETAAGPTATANSAPSGGSPAATPDVAAAADSEARPERFPPERYADLEIVTLLPQDAIPAIDNPQFLSAAEADSFYDPDELVMGVAFEGEARAYSVPFLSRHEIVNDQIGGVEFAVTW